MVKPRIAKVTLLDVEEMRPAAWARPTPATPRLPVEGRPKMARLRVEVLRPGFEAHQLHRIGVLGCSAFPDYCSSPPGRYPGNESVGFVGNSALRAQIVACFHRYCCSHTFRKEKQS